MTTVLLCGGKSVRMGRQKTELPFGETTLLEHMVTLLGRMSEQLVVVVRPGQVIPELSDAVIVRDRVMERGPLGGMQSGLRVAGEYGEWAFVAACDLPFLTARVTGMLSTVKDKRSDILCPHDGARAHPLSAFYRTDIVETIDAMLAEGDLRVRHLLCRHSTLYVDARDPHLQSCLENINTPDAYAQAKDRFARTID